MAKNIHVMYSLNRVEKTVSFSSYDDACRFLFKLKSQVSYIGVSSNSKFDEKLLGRPHKNGLLTETNRYSYAHSYSKYYDRVYDRRFPVSDVLYVEARFELGAWLSVPQMVMNGFGLARAEVADRPYRFRGSTYQGFGPVPGTGKNRGRRGWSGYRRPHTLAEIKLSSVVDEDEPPARPSRRLHALPTSWDDVPRCSSRCWKRQHKGRKSWDR